ncbi:YiiX/YebB-like N1pC/P60 family cysteine hydrolase [Alistipes sp. UBA6068]|uniref:YiiX/YebB-like N1pC/P60 family cysteine hydrolase n=1 Tax=Alistipes sp. UBA6068 TaxID=1946012 RepID=UPI002594B455|nr:YiiX/YebB-like N1pC/P60 family cysteine hydrolase [Alistipes sp. UBA6068]
MRTLILYIGILAGTACTQQREQLRSGDLLFQVGRESAMSGAIMAATGKSEEVKFTHVGIAVISSRADSVLEATSDGGVRMTALSDFLNKSARLNGRPVVVAKRLKDTAGIAAAVARARTFLGQPYDYSFRPDNGKLYCSELVWESYLDPDGRRLFPAQPMNFRAADGSMPPFWNELFAKLGEEIPEGLPGTNPNDMSRDTLLTEVFRWF